MTGYGSQAMWADLERVLVRPPLPADTAHEERYGWRGVPDLAAAQAEHEAFRGLLEEAGAEVVVSEHDPGNPDAIYVYDPVLVGDGGAALLRPGKEGRLGEPEAIAREPRGGGRPGRLADARRRRPSRAATRSGSTTTRSSSGTATAPVPRASPRCATPSPASRWSRSTCRTGSGRRR